MVAVTLCRVGDVVASGHSVQLHYSMDFCMLYLIAALYVLLFFISLAVFIIYSGLIHPHIMQRYLSKRNPWTMDDYSTYLLEQSPYGLIVIRVASLLIVFALYIIIRNMIENIIQMCN